MNDLNINIDDTIEKFLSLVKDKNNKICSIKLREDWFIRHGYHKVWNDFLKVTNFMRGTLTEKVRFCMEGKEYWSEDTFPKCCCGKPVAFMDRKVSIYCSHDCAQRSPLARQRRREALAKVDKEKAKEKRKQTMIDKYGAAYNSQREDIKHIWCKSTLSPEILHYFETDLINDYEVKKMSALEISKKLGCYYGTVTDYLRKKGIKIRHGYNESIVQKELNQFINDLGYQTETNQVGLIGDTRQELDIYVPGANLAIEVDGLFWHSEKYKTKEYHLEKTKLFKGRLIHFTDYQLNNKNDICKSIVMSALGKSKRIYARNTTVETYKSTIPELTKFFNDNHIDGFIAGKQYIVLRYQGEIISAMIIGTSRYQDAQWEILRFTTKLYHNVVGAFSKLFKHANLTGNVVSYVDRSLFDGRTYFHSNDWKYIGETKVGYFWTDGDSVVSRFKAQKKQMSKWNEQYDPNKTEVENMNALGYSRYYNCGNLIFKYDSKM